jgi:putative ABC transport system substrate-binding protein
MKRRGFIAALGSAAVWPLAARAQQTLPVIGLLDSGKRQSMEEELGGFHRGLAEMNFVEGRNLAIEYRWAEGNYDKLPALAAELVRKPVAVIAATRGPAPARAARAATSTIPIVFQTGSDPVGERLVASLSRPGGNVTGSTRQSIELNAKRLGLLRDLVPTARLVALLINPASPVGAINAQELQQPVQSLGMRLDVLKASTERELEAAFAAYAQSGAGALIVGNDPLYIGWRDKIAALAERHRAPAIFPERLYAAAGGLASYGASLSDSFRQVGLYVGRILKGAKPADLPVLQPVKFELVINLKTAKALGLEIPPKLLSTADEVIE